MTTYRSSKALAVVGDVWQNGNIGFILLKNGVTGSLPGVTMGINGDGTAQDKNLSNQFVQCNFIGQVTHKPRILPDLEEDVVLHLYDTIVEINPPIKSGVTGTITNSNTGQVYTVDATGLHKRLVVKRSGTDGNTYTIDDGTASTGTATPVGDTPADDDETALSLKGAKSLVDMINGTAKPRIVADMTARDAATDWVNGDVIHVRDDGSGKWVRFQRIDDGFEFLFSEAKLAQVLSSLTEAQAKDATNTEFGTINGQILAAVYGNLSNTVQRADGEQNIIRRNNIFPAGATPGGSPAWEENAWYAYTETLGNGSRKITYWTAGATQADGWKLTQFSPSNGYYFHDTIASAKAAGAIYYNGNVLFIRNGGGVWEHIGNGPLAFDEKSPSWTRFDAEQSKVYTLSYDAPDGGNTITLKGDKFRIRKISGSDDINDQPNSLTVIVDSESRRSFFILDDNSIIEDFAAGYSLVAEGGEFIYSTETDEDHVFTVDSGSVAISVEPKESAQVYLAKNVNSSTVYDLDVELPAAGQRDFISITNKDADIQFKSPSSAAVVFQVWALDGTKTAHAAGTTLTLRGRLWTAYRSEDGSLFQLIDKSVNDENLVTGTYAYANPSSGAGHRTSTSWRFVSLPDTASITSLDITFRDYRDSFNDGSRSTAQSFTAGELGAGSKSGWTSDFQTSEPRMRRSFTFPGAEYTYYIQAKPVVGGILLKVQDNHSGTTNTYGGFQDLKIHYKKLGS